MGGGKHRLYNYFTKIEVERVTRWGKIMGKKEVRSEGGKYGRLLIDYYTCGKGDTFFFKKVKRRI